MHLYRQVVLNVPVWKCCRLPLSYSSLKQSSFKTSYFGRVMCIQHTHTCIHLQISSSAHVSLTEAETEVMTMCVCHHIVFQREANEETSSSLWQTNKRDLQQTTGPGLAGIYLPLFSFTSFTCFHPIPSLRWSRPSCAISVACLQRILSWEFPANAVLARYCSSFCLSED